jgi:hypothetical protein
METRCKFREEKEGGDICHSPEGCNYQMFGTDNDPIFCAEGEFEKTELDQNVRMIK